MSQQSVCLQTISGSISTGVGVSGSGCQRITLSRESTEKYNINRNYQTSNTHTIKSRFQATSAATFYKPVGFNTSLAVGNIADGDTIPKTLFCVSTAADVIAVRIIGYNTSGAVVEEGLTLTGTTAVSTVQSYLGISNFFIRNTNTANTGRVSISDLNT